MDLKVLLDIDYFEELVHLLSLFLQKQDTNMRECISPKKGAGLR